MKIQLCLSGGGARGFAHLGAIQAFHEMGISIVRISGTSAGAMAGAFIAAGYEPEEILEIFIRNQFFKMFNGAFNRGLLKMGGMEKLFKEHLPETFEELKIPLIIGVTDILKGKSQYLSDGELIPVILGSGSIPGLFKPIQHRGMLMVDGGILNNLPVEPLLKYAPPVIGIHVNPVGIIAEPTTTWSVLQRTFHLGVFSNTVYREAKCTVVIEPVALKEVKVFDYSKAREIYTAGYEQVKRQAVEILQKCS